MKRHLAPMQDTLWFKDAIIYELHVRSFCDSTGDGVGDFHGLTGKLDYLENLGVNALWVLPFYPSPLRDDGYDIADYFSVHSAYGTVEDFREFLDEAHRRRLRVITELVINHTSDQHQWFQRARRAAPGSPERDFYVWSDTPRRFEEARIIFQDFESSNWSWDPLAHAYFWHRFYSHQPDLNFDNPRVREAVFQVVDFWLEMGVDGLRLDAVPYLFEREGTSCENLPETHAYLRELRRHVDARHPGRMLLAEANQWPEDAARYFGSGDECHMAFHFPLMPRLFMGLQMEDRFPIIDILEQTPEIPVSCQWAVFLRNHDELTLEMVTDEERDYMYRLYAEEPRARINLGIRRRLAPLLGNNRRKIDLINSLLLSLPGTPILYYGDEIGMGDNFYLGDRNGVRTPMQWSSDRNAGFSQANPQQLFLPIIIDPEFHYEAVNVDVQVRNLSSLFWWMRRIVDIRKRHPAFSRGAIEFLRPANAKILAFLRKGGAGETILVVANLSRFSQAVALDLPAYKGCSAIEMFGGSRFVDITEQPTAFTIGPHGFYWLSLTASGVSESGPDPEIPPLELEPEWSDELLAVLRFTALPRYLAQCRWFGHKQGVVRVLRIAQNFSDPDGMLHVLLLDVAFTDGTTVTQVLPLAFGREEEGDAASSEAIVARFRDGAVLWDALSVPACRARLWKLMLRGESWKSPNASLSGRMDPAASTATPAASHLLGGEQSNTTIAYDELFLLKFLRRFEPGPHPDAEILRALGEREFPHAPRLAAEIRCRCGQEDGLLAMLTTYVKNDGDGWTFTLDAISRFFERVIAAQMQEPSVSFEELLGAHYPGRARQLGDRTGALHRCLEGFDARADFSPEPFTPLYQRSLYQSMRSLLRRTEREVTARLSALDPDLRQQVKAWTDALPRVLGTYAVLLQRRFHAAKIRVHGDYHLGQVLNTGNDFVIVDFEGEPRRSLGERLLKRSPLVDVAGMLRSFDYAMETSLLQQKEDDRTRLRPWAARWLSAIRREFLTGYREAVRGTAFLPPAGEEFQLLLKLFLLDKAVYETGYELSYRPAFLSIPLGAVARLLGDEEAPEPGPGSREPNPS
ncbi:MAG: maltose alpha-D-glucosyltransferase [Terrimicrobiaceae bacterium]|nr:maltose alpha-D-glucosyltransferase [Terrimicrobiaceae bacterium]